MSGPARHRDPRPGRGHERRAPHGAPGQLLLHEERILIRSGTGTKLDAALRNAVVAFEADDFDLLDHSGWSVVVTGVARALTAPEELAAVKALPLARWAPTGDDHVVAISTDMVSGRRLDRLRTKAFPAPSQLSPWL